MGVWRWLWWLEEQRVWLEHFVRDATHGGTGRGGSDDGACTVNNFGGSARIHEQL